MRNALTTLVFLFFSFVLIAQDSGVDKVTYMSGEVENGKIIKLDAENVYFLPDGASVTDTVPRTQIVKVVFANGKTQFFQPTQVSRVATTTPEERKGIIAILPFELKNKDFEGFDPEMSITIQKDCIELFEKMSKGYVIQNPDTTLARLRRGGVTVGNVTEILPADMARLLGAQFVSYGSVWIAENTSSKGDKNYFESENATAEDPNAARSNPSLTAKKFQTIVDLNVYNDMGEMAYTKVQESFWAVSDAYKLNLETIVKESPFVPKPKKPAPEPKKQ